MRIEYDEHDKEIIDAIYSGRILLADQIKEGKIITLGIRILDEVKANYFLSKLSEFNSDISKDLGISIFGCQDSLPISIESLETIIDNIQLIIDTSKNNLNVYNNLVNDEQDNNSINEVSDDKEDNDE